MKRFIILILIVILTSCSLFERKKQIISHESIISQDSSMVENEKNLEVISHSLVRLHFDEVIFTSGPIFLTALYTALKQNYKPTDLLDPYYKPVRAKARNLPNPVVNLIKL